MPCGRFMGHELGRSKSCGPFYSYGATIRVPSERTAPESAFELSRWRDGRCGVGCANSVSAIRRTRGTRTSQIGGSKASAASLAPMSRWRSQLRDWSRRHDCPVCAAIQVAPALPRKLWPPNHHLLGMRTDTPSVRRRASPPGVQQLRQAASRSRR